MSEPIVVRINPDLQDIVPLFLDGRRRALEPMRQAISASDFEILRVQGHQMKGTGAGFGFEKISSIGSVLEAAAQQHDVETARRAVEELTDYLERVEVVYGVA